MRALSVSVCMLKLETRRYFGQMVRSVEILLSLTRMRVIEWLWKEFLLQISEVHIQSVPILANLDICFYFSNTKNPFDTRLRPFLFIFQKCHIVILPYSCPNVISIIWPIGWSWCELCLSICWYRLFDWYFGHIVGSAWICSDVVVTLCDCDSIFDKRMPCEPMCMWILLFVPVPDVTMNKIVSGVFSDKDFLS